MVLEKVKICIYCSSSSTLHCRKLHLQPSMFAIKVFVKSLLPHPPHLNVFTKFLAIHVTGDAAEFSFSKFNIVTKFALHQFEWKLGNACVLSEHFTLLLKVIKFTI